MVFQRQQNILPDCVFIGVVQDFLRGLTFQPVPEFLLFGKHLLI